MNRPDNQPFPGHETNSLNPQFTKSPDELTSEVFGCSIRLNRDCAADISSSTYSMTQLLEEVSRHIEDEPLSAVECFESRQAFFEEGMPSKLLNTAVSRFLRDVTPTLADRKTLEALEFESIYALTQPRTRVGEVVGFRSLLTPCMSAAVIAAKQEAQQELEQNSKLRISMEKYLSKFKKKEEHLLDFIVGDPKYGTAYLGYRDMKNALCGMTEAVDQIPETKSPYLKCLVDYIKDFRNSRTYELLQGGIVRTKDGLKTFNEVTVLTPAWRFYPMPFSPGTILASMPGAMLLLHINSNLPALISAAPGLNLLAGMAAVVSTLAPILWGLTVKSELDSRTVGNSLRRMTLEDPLFINAVESVGRLDEILGLLRYKESIAGPSVYPVVVDHTHHFMNLRGVRNPSVTYVKDHSFVPNDVDCSLHGLTFLTGPNSGGKTTLCKTLGQIQLIAQIGGAIPAESGKIGITDRLSYQSPQSDTLNDSEGRFGTEMQRTKEIFYRSTKRSFSILDELGEGTTRQEKADFAKSVMEGQAIIGGTSILVTHNHELVTEFSNRGLGQCLQLEFDDGNPTYKVIPGISRTSHADRIARRQGFSREDIARFLDQRGHV